MPTLAEFLPQFGTAVHNSAGRFATKSGGAPQAQQAAYFEALYGLLVAIEWSVDERLQQQGWPPQARDFVGRFVRDQVLADVIPRSLGGQFAPSSPQVAQALAGHRGLLAQREQEYRQQLQAANVPFSQLHAARILTAVGFNPNDSGSLGAAMRDVDEAIAALRLPEAAVYLTTQ
ncbi:MAG: hypothetical protein ACREQM_08255 [Candidatus Dormibacteraceae bacterium]